MHFQNAILALASLAAVSAQKSSGKTHQVTVGADEQLKFDPAVIIAAPGDKVEFWFYPLNHSVVAGGFDKPCWPADDDSWYSGYVPVSSGMSAKTWTVTVKDTDPIWLYCSQEGHCQGGMAAVINPEKGGSTLEEYVTAARRVQDSKWPAKVQGGVFAKANSGGGSSPTATSGGGSPTKSAGGAPTSSSDAAVQTMAGRAIVGGVAGLAAWAML